MRPVAEHAALGFGGLLRQLRDRAGLTQEELAEAAGLSQRAVSDLERGINRTARKDTARLLASALGLAGPQRALFEAAARGRAAAAAVLAAHGPPDMTLGNLPAQLATFVGRGRELAEIRALVDSCRLVTLTGTGGSGKTRLGLQVAAGLAGGPGDGVWLVELAAVLDEDAVAPAIARALGITGQPGRPALEGLLDALAPLDVLIVVDNCEHLIGACAVTAEAIVRRCTRVRLLATSREPLGIGGEMIYRVPPLSLPAPGERDLAAAGSSDAVALFADRARAQGAALRLDEQTTPLVVSICRRLDGLPLAIELAAARLGSLSLSDLHNRLDQRFRLLTRGSRTALPRQQTLQATVEWSYSLLTGAERVLLGRLSVFAEGFDLDAAEAVCGAGGIAAADVVGLLGSLVDKSLVVAEPTGAALRHRLLETIRQFAAERLAETGQGEAAAVAAAHCAYYLSVAETAAPYLTGSAQGLWFARLDADQANLRRAAEHAAGDPGATGLALRLGVALRHYWFACSRHQEAVDLLLPVLDRPEARVHPELLAAALVTAAIAAREAGLAAAGQLGQRAVELARRLEDDRLLIEALSAQCRYYYFARQPEQAFPLGQEAVERARQLGDDFLLGLSLLDLLLNSELMDPAHARQLFIQAVAATERSGDRRRSYRLHNNAAVDALRAGDTAAARAHLDQAMEAMQAIGEENSHVIMNKGWVLRQENDTEGARSTFEAVLRISRRNGDRSGLAYAGLGLACLAADRGDWQLAAALHGAAQGLTDQIAEPWQEPEARYRRDSIHKIHSSFGEEPFWRAHAKGMTLSLDEILEVALGRAVVA